ncbi:MAG TPA: hypothetical protein VFS53_05620 [Gemmatimonadota bacterium]|nr:hypothetical protein [Gemmatimonadota bacterium]
MENKARPEPASCPEQPAYDPPKVEKVIGADELAREVHYAGVDVSPGRAG